MQILFFFFWQLKASKIPESEFKTLPNGLKLVHEVCCPSFYCGFSTPVLTIFIMVPFEAKLQITFSCILKIEEMLLLNEFTR